MPTKQFGVSYDPATTPLDGTETLSIVQGGVTVDATTQDIADLGGGGGTVTSVGYALDAAVADILSATGSPITTSGTITVDAVDPGADRIVFWDDSAGKLTYLTLGTNLSITGTTINASGGGTGTVDTIVAGTGIAVDSTDPANPIVSVDNDVTAATSTSGVLTIDCSAGDYFTHALDENVTSWSITNLPGSGKGATKMIRFTQDSTPRTVAWPASFRWAGGADGVISTGSGAIDVLAITTFDNGTTWIATLNNAFAV